MRKLFLTTCCLPARLLWILLMEGGLSAACLFGQQWHTVPNGSRVGIPIDLPCVGPIIVEVIKVINGKLYVGGDFQSQCNSPGNAIAIFNPISQTWDSLGCGLNNKVRTIEEFNGEIYAGGGFWLTCNASNLNGFAKWDGFNWVRGATPAGNASAVVIKHHNNLYIGGGGNTIGGVSSIFNPYHCCVFSYDGTGWGNMAGGIADSFGFPGVYCMAVYKGNLIVSGEFTHAAGKGGYNYIASWDGTKWDSLGSGMDWVVGSLAVDTVNDLLYAGGGFTKAGGSSTLYYAVWDGATWQPIFAPSPNKPPAATLGNYAMKFWNGKLYVASMTTLPLNPYDTSLMYYDPPTNTWHQVYGPNNRAYALEVYNGNLYVAGAFDKIDTTTVNYIACYGDSCPGTPITLTLPYGVNDPETSSGLRFKVYPNPAKRELNIELAVGRKQLAGKEKYTVRIKNSIGQMVKEYQFKEKNFTISTADYKKGLYLVEVCDLTPGPSPKGEGSVCHTEKVVIE